MDVCIFASLHNCSFFLAHIQLCEMESMQAQVMPEKKCFALNALVHNTIHE